MGTINDTKKTTQQMAQQIAKQMAQEPLEILKAAGRQVSGAESLPSDSARGPLAENKKEEVTPQLKEKIKVQGERQLEALNKEIEDMESQKLFADLQRRIAEGEEVSLTDISGLTREQIDVLKAQEEAVSARKEEAANQKPLEVPSSKPSRNFAAAGQRAEAEKQKTHVERPLPPSG